MPIDLRKLINSILTGSQTRRGGTQFKRIEPADGKYEFFANSAQPGPQGIQEQAWRVAHGLACGHFVRSDSEIGGECVAGKMVCKSHYLYCPRNSDNPHFDWKNSPRVRSCTNKCRLINAALRILHWLTTAPEGSPPHDNSI